MTKKSYEDLGIYSHSLIFVWLDFEYLKDVFVHSLVGLWLMLHMLSDAFKRSYGRCDCAGVGIMVYAHKIEIWAFYGVVELKM